MKLNKMATAVAMVCYIIGAQWRQKNQQFS